MTKISQVGGAIGLILLTGQTSLGFTLLPLEPVSRCCLFSSVPAIGIESLTCSHDGVSYQLDDVSYVLQRGNKFGLVGRNGCGKSSFLKILAQETGASNMAADGIKYQATAIACNKNTRVAFVEQDPPMPSDVSVGDSLLGVGLSDFSSNPVLMAVRAYKMASSSSSQDDTSLQKAMLAMESLAPASWGTFTKADEVATKLRVSHLEHEPLSQLSGGERKRVALAAALIQDPDILLLDEPTNHLDLAAIAWLEDLLTRNSKLTVLVVTHDRAFLEQVCTTILELDEGKLYSYKGNYADYLQGKEERFALQDAAIQSAKTSYRKELDWMRRQPQARQSKSKARIEAFYKLEKATKPRIQSQGIELEAQGRRLGNNILKLTNANLSFGTDKVMLQDFSYEFCGGDRIAVVGFNGVGKSTFIKVLHGSQALDSGSIEKGENTVIGVYDQMGIKLSKEEEELTVMEYVMEKVKDGSGNALSGAPEKARKLLKRFEFQRQRWNDRVYMLSGGECRRLQLLTVLSKNPNFLILDEPSNDLDLNTLAALEDYLQEYKGVLVVVSHDKFFTDKVTNHLFVFEGSGSVKDYAGSLSEYAGCLIEQENAHFQSKDSSGRDDEDKKEKYKDNKEKRNEQRNSVRAWKKEMTTLDKAIEKLKLKSAKLEKEMEESADDGWSVLADLTEQINDLNEIIDEKELRWLEVAESLEQQQAEEVATNEF